MRPNLHIDDYIEAVDIFINAPIEKLKIKYLMLASKTIQLKN